MIRTATIDLPPVNRQEILRYAGIRSETPELSHLLDEALELALPLLTGSVCWGEFPLHRQGEMLDLSFARTDSHDLRRALAGCDRIILFAATIGLSLDRLIARQSRTSPAKALMLQAIGTERIEGLCDVFCTSLQQSIGPVTPRFSPGYGDLPLDLQTDIFRVLDCPRKIGLTLNDSLLMSPSKSVTAIMGVGKGTCGHTPLGCSQCSKTDCMYRRTP